MNFAFPALLAFLLCLPGVILRYAYARGSWGWSSPTSLRRVYDELAYGIVLSIPLHVGALWIARLLGHCPDVRVPIAFLSGSFGRDNGFYEPSLHALADHQGEVAAYFLGLYFAAWALGYWAHRSVRRWRLDHRFKLLRFNNYWFYMLSGEVACFHDAEERDVEPDGVYLSAVITHGPTSFLYRGIIADFTFDDAGLLDTITLTGAHRRKLTDDRKRGAESNEDVAARYYDIDGDYLILRRSELQTINLDYFWLRPEPAADGIAT